MGRSWKGPQGPEDHALEVKEAWMKDKKNKIGRPWGRGSETMEKNV